MRNPTLLQCFHWYYPEGGKLWPELADVLIHLKYEKKPGGHWIIRDLMGLDLVGLASL